MAQCDPHRGDTATLDRAALLEELFARGRNPYRIGRLRDGKDPARYPVFIRRINDHLGRLSKILLDAESYHLCLARLRSQGEDWEQLMWVEYCDTCSPDGRFRKYSAFRIGEHLIPGHVITTHDWVPKDSAPAPLGREERDYLRDNPHANELMDIFRIANIEYGRIDYSMLGSRIVTWEINTNPLLIQEPATCSESMLPWKRRLVTRLARAFLDGFRRAESWKAAPTPAAHAPTQAAR